MRTLFSTTDVYVNPEVTGAVMEASLRAASTGCRLDDRLLAAALIRVTAVSQALGAVGVDVPRATDALAALPGTTPWYRFNWRTLRADTPIG
jgi:hypothetical protein